jgi:nucleotide-binding universal stress UspA family protein
VLSVEVPQHSAERQAEARQVVDRVMAFYQAEGVEAEGLVGRGLPHEVIAQTMRERGCDLVVMGSHGRTGLGRLLLGSNSERVIGQAECPVLVVRGA